MPTSNSSNNPGNGSAFALPKSSTGVLDSVRQLITKPVHFLLRLYFAILLYVYFLVVRIFSRLLQPLEPFFEEINKGPQREVTPEGIRNQFSQLLVTILLYLSPLVSRVIGVVARPIGWARDKLVEYVEQDEKAKQTDPKER